jgi:hypothetical protein
VHRWLTLAEACKKVRLSVSRYRRMGIKPFPSFVPEGRRNRLVAFWDLEAYMERSAPRAVETHQPVDAEAHAVALRIFNKHYSLSSSQEARP